MTGICSKTRLRPPSHWIGKDAVFAVVTGAAVLMLLAPLALLVISLVEQGGGHLSASFLVTAPAAGGAAGGIAPVLVSTLMIVGLALAVVLPIGLGTALFLTESLAAGSRAARHVGFTLDSLAAVPSIVFGLFGYQLFAISLGLGFSILSGALTLACMILPLFVRAAEQSLRLCPSEYRAAASALGISRCGFVLKVLLPTALPGIGAGTVLSLGRALAETAVLLLTAGYVLRMPDSVFDSGRALSLHIYDLAMNVPDGMPAAAAAALVLLALLIAVNAAVRYLSHRMSDEGLRP